MSPQLLIIIALGVLFYVLMVRPQQAKARAQRSLLGAVEVGDEILTVGGIYGIVQEVEPDEDGGDLVVEIAEGIHVRIARKALATVIKPEDEDEDAEDEAGDDEDDATGDGDEDEAGAEDDAVADVDSDVGPEEAELPPAGVEAVNDEQDSVNPGAAGGTAAPERS